MKKALSILFLITFSLSITFAQPSGYAKLSENDAAAVVKAINAFSGKVNTLKVDFKQEKTSKAFTDKVVSQGKMSYKKSNFLRWSYTSPTTYSIILNEKGAFLKNAKGSTKNKALGELGGLIARTISGDGLTQNKDFKITFYKNKDIVAYMQPINKRLQGIYKSIEVYLNPKNYSATKVKLNEKNGDVTVITFTGHQTNVTLSANEFKE